MANRTVIDVNILDPASLKSAIDRINTFKKKVMDAIEELVKALVEEGESQVHIEIALLGAIDEGELDGSVYTGYYDPKHHVGYIAVDGDHAWFVEYGTGVVGAANPHPEPEFSQPSLSGYSGYDSMGHGDRGWVYYKDTHQEWHWTKGMPSRPFMYNTYRYLERILNSTANDAFSKL